MKRKIIIILTLFFLNINKLNAISNITINNNTLNPTFNENIFIYNVYVSEETQIITINAVGEKEEIITGTGSKSLKKGLNTLEIVSYQNDKINKTYTLNIIRGDLQNKKSTSKLKSLIVKGIDINFDSNIMDYNIENNDNKTIDIYYEAENPLSNVRLITSNINDYTKKIKLEVKSEDKSSKSIYTINIKERKESTINNSKESLFDKKEFSYLELNLIKLGIIIVDLAIIIYSFYFWIIKKRTNKVLNILHSTPRR